MPESDACLDAMKTQSEVYRHLLRYRLTSVRTVIEWADYVTDRIVDPPVELIDVAYAASKGAEEVAGLLARFRGNADADAVWSSLMKGFLDAVCASPERDSELAKRLFFMASGDEVVGADQHGELFSFWDAVDLAREGIYGDLTEERAKMIGFLRRMSGG